MSEARLLRALSRGGLGTLSAAGLTIYRGKDLRRKPIGILSRARFDTLHGAGAFTTESGVRHEYWRWSGRCALPADDVPYTSPLEATLLPGPKRERRTFLQHLTADDADGGPRRGAAAARYVGEMERASCAQTITMNWRGLAEGHISGGTGPKGPAIRGGRERASLQRLHSKLEAIDGTHLEGLLVREWSCAAFMRHAGLARRTDAHAEGIALLDRLADAYDQYVPASR